MPINFKNIQFRNSANEGQQQQMLEAFKLKLDFIIKRFYGFREYRKKAVAETGLMYD